MGCELQSSFDLTIGRLDRVLSELVRLGRAAKVYNDAKGKLQPPDISHELMRLLDEENQQTLKHHAEDMIAAGEKILKDLGKGVEGTPQPEKKAAASPTPDRGAVAYMTEGQLREAMDKEADRLTGVAAAWVMDRLGPMLRELWFRHDHLRDRLEAALERNAAANLEAERRPFPTYIGLERVLTALVTARRMANEDGWVDFAPDEALFKDVRYRYHQEVVRLIANQLGVASEYEERRTNR